MVYGRYNELVNGDDNGLYTNKINWLVVWNIWIIFPIILKGMSSSHLTFIFFRGVGIPPTRL
jgi:hypothetical protein